MRSHIWRLPLLTQFSVEQSLFLTPLTTRPSSFLCRRPSPDKLNLCRNLIEWKPVSENVTAFASLDTRETSLVNTPSKEITVKESPKDHRPTMRLHGATRLSLSFVFSVSCFRVSTATSRLAYFSEVFQMLCGALRGFSYSWSELSVKATKRHGRSSCCLFYWQSRVDAGTLYCCTSRRACHTRFPWRYPK